MGPLRRWLYLRFSHREHGLCHSHSFPLASPRPVVRRVPTCMTMACCCPAELTSSEGWSSCVARWPRKATTSIQLMLRKMTQTSGGAAQIQTMQMGGKVAFVFELAKMLKYPAQGFVSSRNVSFYFSLNISLPTPTKVWFDGKNKI